ncbi:MAG: cation transporter [Bacteroidales bacterium]|nr:cation transporter [Bacteroidales bacterium]
MKIKIKTARLSVISNTFLILLKLIAGIISGSVSIISEAIHSSIDLIAAVIAYFAVKVSDNPPDSNHPYGHGKMENISGVVEALLIIVAAIWIIAEAVKRILGEEAVLGSLWLGSLVMIISAVVNWFVSRRLYRVARETGSLALEADALHLRTDVYTSAGVAAGLGLIILTGIKWFDPVIAILVALFILKESAELLSRSFRPLLDSSWSPEEINTLEKLLDEMGVRYHDLRTRKAGNYRFIDVHVEVPGKESVNAAHEYCDDIELKLMDLFENLNVTIHVEPG